MTWERGFNVGWRGWRWLVLMAWAFGPGVEAGTFTNPIVVPGADPWVIRHEGRYVYTATAGNRIDVRRSETLAGLGSAPPVTVWRAPSEGPCSRDIWAPEIHRVGERWFIYFTATDEHRTDSNRRIFVLRSKNAEVTGGYEELGKLAVPGEDEYAIDGTLCQHTDGRLYFFWSGREKSARGPQNLYVARMRNAWTLEAPRVRLSTPDRPWERHGWAVNEGPQVLKRGDRLWIVYSGSGYSTPQYALGLLSFKGGDLLDAGAWTKRDRPLFQEREVGGKGVYGPGHNCFLLDPVTDESWIIYHAWDQKETKGLSRNVRAQRFGWTAAGEPDLGLPVLPGEAIPVPGWER